MTVPAQNAENQPQISEKELNFRAMQAKYERDLEAERNARLQAEQRAAAYEKSKAPEEEEDDDDQSYIDKRVLSKTLSKFEANLEKKIDQKAEARARAMIEQERQSTFFKSNSDFNNVMSAENIQKFAEKYPGIAENILENVPEGFGRQKLLYQTMKEMGIGRKEEPKGSSIQETIDRNRQTPFQPSSFSTPAYQGQKGDFSPAGQKAAWEKMQSLIKGRRT
ncbi:MAG: hypothetical protein KGZ39_00350 [Simkania sp.]|nr:hypothetical protein [Simkania sp.]